MNTKLSGAQLVLVEIKRLGENKLPLVQYLADKVVKYIDFAPTQYLPGVANAVGLSNTENMYLSVKNEQGNEFLQYEMPLERFDYNATLGVRQPIGSKISLPNSYINCQNENNIGKVAALVVYYDLPTYSAKNNTTTTKTDAISIPITTSIRANVFPDADRFTGKRFRKILLAAPSVTPDRQPGLTQVQLANCYLTLRKGTYNVVENMPLPLLYQLQMLEKSEWANIIFDFQNSYITIGGAGTIPNVEKDYIGKQVFLNLQYEAK